MAARKAAAKPKATAGNKGGRPRKEIDFDQLDELCEIQCTAEECAAVLKMTPDTLDARIKEVHGFGFSEYFRQKAPAGRVSLRRRQWEKTKTNDNVMLVWLGKQYLGQRDKSDNKIDGGLTIEIVKYAKGASPK